MVVNAPQVEYEGLRMPQVYIRGIGQRAHHRSWTLQPLAAATGRERVNGLDARLENFFDPVQPVWCEAPSPVAE